MLRSDLCAFLLLAALLLSGCTSSDGDPGNDQTPNEENGAHDDNGSDPGDDPPPGGDPPPSDPDPPSNPPSGDPDPAGNETNEEDPDGHTQEESGTLTFQGESCILPSAYATAGTIPLGTPADGVTRIVFEVDERTIGQSFQVTWTHDTGYIEAAVFFTSTGGDIVQDHIAQGPEFGDLTISGTVPDGAEMGVLYSCGGPAEASVQYISAP